MAILNRVGSLIRANRGATRSSEGSAESGIDEALAGLDAALAEAREGLAAAITHEKLLQAELHNAESLALEWGDKAVDAVNAGDDVRARDALRRQRDHQRRADTLAKQLATFATSASQMRRSVQALEKNHAEAQSAKEHLAARLVLAQSRQALATHASGTASDDLRTSHADFDRAIRRAEALAAATAEIAGELAAPTAEVESEPRASLAAVDSVIEQEPSRTS